MSALVNTKALRKSIRATIAEYKQTMLGKYSITDLAGKKWKIEYNILYWRKDWEEYDYYLSAVNQTELISEVILLDEQTMDTFNFCVEITLMCGDKEYKSKKYKFTGEEIICLS